MIIHKQKLDLFKRELDENNCLTIQVPFCSRILRISRQYPDSQDPWVWYAFDERDKDRLEDCQIMVVGTGQPFDGRGKTYLGTEFFHHGQLVLHFYRR